MINDVKQSTSTNPLLAQAEQKVEGNLTPANKANYLKAVTAGLKAGINGGPQSILASLKDSKNPINDCAVGAINLSIILRKESRNTMPVKCMIPAAMTLMVKSLGFAENMGLIKVGPKELSQATKIFADHLIKCFKMTPEMIQTAIGKVHQASGDPASVQKMRQSMSQPNATQAAPAAQQQPQTQQVAQQVPAQGVTQ